MAGEMSLSKPFLKDTKTNSLFCLRSIAVCDNPTKCVLNTLLQFAHVETGQISEKLQ